MEKSENLAFVELKTDWKDYGSWQSIYNNKEKDKNNNAIEGNFVTAKVSDSLIFSSKELSPAIVLVGLEAIESLYHFTPSNSRINSILCSTPLKSNTAFICVSKSTKDAVADNAAHIFSKL